MGSRGPIPKRKDQTRRRNKKEIEEAPSGEPHQDGNLSDYQRINPHWHPIARRWFKSLRESGQSRFYEPSDWMLAQIIAESMSREFHPQNVNTRDRGVVKVTLPPKSASLTVWLQAMTALLATEGERRRAQLELQHGGGGAAEEAVNESNVLQLYTDEFAGESS